MPTFQNMLKGSHSPGIVAIPGRRFGAARPNKYGQFVRSKPFRSKSFSSRQLTIAGVTKDSSGVALASCTVQLFRTSDDAFLSDVVSDFAGNYLFYPLETGPFYIVAYKAGAPDVAGTTVNTLVGA